MNPLILCSSILSGAFMSATDTDPDSVAGYDVLHLRDWRPYTLHRFASAGTKYYTLDCGAGEAADTLALMGHNYHSAGATVSLEYSATGAWAGEEVEAVAGFTPSAGRAVMKAFTTATARYWRLKVVTASEAAHLGIMALGERLEFPKPPDAGFAPAEEGVEAEMPVSEGGYPLAASVRHRTVEVRPVWSRLGRDWLMGTLKPAYDAHLSILQPFFWHWNLDDAYLEPMLVWLRGDYTWRPGMKVMERAEKFSMAMRGVKEG